jgi:hypothetical protein
MSAIHWKNAVSADFSTAADWSAGVPGVSDDAILDAAGSTKYTVTASLSESVHSIQTAATATLNITVGNGNGGFFASAGTGTGVNAGTISVANNSNFVFGGTVNNTGKISVNSGGNTTSLQVEAAGATLTGAGAVTLGDNGNNQIIGDAATATLTNVNDTISGAGIIGLGNVNPAYLPVQGLVLINQAAGVINATGANALTINTGTNVVSNAGLLESTGPGGLTIDGVVSNTGTIKANAASSVILNNADIAGGTLTSLSTGAVRTAGGTVGSLLDGVAAAVTNSGTLVVTNNSDLNLQGTLTNTGTLDLNSGGNTTALVVTAKNAVINGGKIVLTDNGNNQIDGTLSGPRGAQTVSSLTNASVISGTGTIGANLQLNNTGTIDATGSGALIIATGSANVAGSSTIANSGTLEATNPGKLTATGGLVLSGVTLVNATTGKLYADGLTTHIDLSNATVSGGELVTASGGVIDTSGGNFGSVLDGLTAKVTNDAIFNITNNSSLTIEGTIEAKTTGAIDLNSGGNTTALVVAAGNAALEYGVVVLTDNANNIIEGTITGARGAQHVSTLTNDTIISGSGSIGHNLIVRNAYTTSVIDATGGSALIIASGAASVANSNSIYNTGLLESTNPGKLSAVGGLVLDGVIVGNVEDKGIIEANGLHTHVDLETATIRTGVLKTLTGGVIQTVDRGSLLDGTTSSVLNEATVNILNNTSLTIQGAIDDVKADGASINLGSGGNTTQLIIGAKNATLSGGGAVTLTDNSNNQIFGAAVGATLTNVDNTISGSGQLGNGELTLVNQAAGVIQATGPGSALVLNTGAAVVSNIGLLEGVGAAGLVIQNTTVNNTGTILAGNGSAVILQSAVIDGGVLNVTGTGFFETVDGVGGNGAGSLLNGQTSAVQNEGQININNNTALTLQGTIANTGEIALNSGGNTTELIIDVTGATLNGTGDVTLSPNGNNLIVGVTSASTLTNFDNTISGGGNLGNGSLTLVNQAAGVIDADVGTTLVLNVGPAAVTNAGLIEATSTGGLLIQSSTITNTGTILAGDGSTVSLQNAFISGGALAVAGTGAFQTTDFNSVLNGRSGAVNNTGLINVLNNTGLTVQGTINNTGEIDLGSGGNATELIVDVTGATLTGLGDITLDNNGNNYIFGATASAVLTNVNNTISGGGQIGNGQMVLVNQSKGVIDGDLGTALVLNTGTSTITNAGLIESDAGGGTLVINSAVANTGVIEANGGLLQVNAAITGTGKLEVNGGTLELTQVGVTSAVAFVTPAGTLQLDNSQTFGGTVKGMSTTVGTTLDLSDIGFGGSTKATFAGTTTSGVLTVTDGTHTAKITLLGNYTNSTFNVASDGHGGTDVTDPKKTTGAVSPTPTHAFIAAMAAFGAGADSSGVHSGPAARNLAPLIASPAI